MAPSFFRIMFYPSSPHLALPPPFVSKYLENNIPIDPIILNVDGGHSWRVMIKKCGDGLCFANGWSDVVKDIPLLYADFLIFQLVDQSTFKMTVFSANGCEYLFPQNDDEHDHHHDDEDDNGDEKEEKEEEEKDPSFTVIITKTHKTMLRLPEEFVELAGINGDEGSMKMKNLDGREWLLGLKLDASYKNKRYLLSRGWREFRRENDLSEGDECVFKFVRSGRKLLLANVSKKSSVM